MSDLAKYLEAMKRARTTNRQVLTQEEAEKSPYDPKRDGPRVVLADQEAVQSFRSKHVCGECRHFRLRQGQEEAHRTKFFERLFDMQEHNHNRIWYNDLHLLGLCAAWDGHMCHAMAPCKIPKHLINSDLAKPDPITGGPHPDKDSPVNCPYFAESSSFRREMKVYLGGGKTYDPE